MERPVGSLVRIGSFLSKELREVIRRPGALISTVGGPFLVMLVFGLGYSGFRAPFATYIVIPESMNLPRDPEYYSELAPGRIVVEDVGTDAEAAEERLRDNEIDLVIIAPEDAVEQLRNGQQTTINVIWNQVDPVYDQLARLATSTLVSSLNAEIVEAAAAEGISIAESELGPAVPDVSPEVVARPTTAETDNLAPTEPDVVSYFGPAVFALVIQHLAVTLTALSLVRERLSGQLDRFRVAPVTSSELLIGKYVAYGVLSLAVAAAVGALLVGVLGVPMLGGWLTFAGIVMLLTFASLGVGLLISLVADSERQAVQLSMILLLGSVFFSGFVLPVSDFAQWAQIIAYALPVTSGIALLQDLMLRGAIQDAWMVGLLAAIGLVLYVFSLVRLRRIMRRAD
jgi:ABC-2 type transport system permease protein